jgi:hypothetical protein
VLEATTAGDDEALIEAVKLARRSGADDPLYAGVMQWFERRKADGKSMPSHPNTRLIIGEVPNDLCGA